MRSTGAAVGHSTALLHEVMAPPAEAAPAEVAPKRNRRRWALSGALPIVALASQTA